MTDRFECQICERSWKAKRDGTLVNHGYQRPGWGYIVGNCFGVGHLPFPATTAIDRAIAYARSAREQQLGLAETATQFPVKVGTDYSRNRRGREVFETVGSPREYFETVYERRGSETSWERLEEYCTDRYEAGVAKQRAAHRLYAQQAWSDIQRWTIRKARGDRAREGLTDA